MRSPERDTLFTKPSSRLSPKPTDRRRTRFRAGTTAATARAQGELLRGVQVGSHSLCARLGLMHKANGIASNRYIIDNIIEPTVI